MASDVVGVSLSHPFCSARTLPFADMIVAVFARYIRGKNSPYFVLRSPEIVDFFAKFSDQRVQIVAFCWRPCHPAEIAVAAGRVYTRFGLVLGP